MFKKIMALVAGVSVVAFGVETVREMKSVGAKKEDFVTHADLMRGTYFGETKIWNVNGINVYGVYSPITVAVSQALYASANYDAGNRVVMCYDKNFTELTEEEQYAIACHEAGHLHYNHDFRVRKLENELAADAYAVAVVGNKTMISVLKKIISKKKYDKELVARINALA
jgi:Zn-dependent protease with chaperone function